MTGSIGHTYATNGEKARRRKPTRVRQDVNCACTRPIRAVLAEAVDSSTGDGFHCRRLGRLIGRRARARRARPRRPIACLADQCARLLLKISSSTPFCSSPARASTRAETPAASATTPAASTQARPPGGSVHSRQRRLGLLNQIGDPGDLTFEAPHAPPAGTARVPRAVAVTVHLPHRRHDRGGWRWVSAGWPIH